MNDLVFCLIIFLFMSHVTWYLFSDAQYRMQGNIIGGVKGSIKDHRWQVSIQYHHDIKERNLTVAQTFDFVAPGTKILTISSSRIELSA